MKITEVLKCPVCDSNELEVIKPNKKCKICNTIIGIEKTKLWYEYPVKIDDLQIKYNL